MSGVPGSPLLWCEHLEPRDVPATAVVVAGVLTITGTPGDDRIRVFQDAADLVVLDGTTEIARVTSAGVTSIAITTGDGDDTVFGGKGD
ncbi:MAG TPA: hypothetical protein VMZ71_06340, partial [Gemmataceae bacterium]|nr:hypothetical protein [Gemmataceae bacterium]